MNIFIWLIIGILLNAFIGATVCSLMDTKDEIFYKWYKKDPTGGFIPFFVIELWPIMAYFMYRYKKEIKTNEAILHD